MISVSHRQAQACLFTLGAQWRSSKAPAGSGRLDLEGGGVLPRVLATHTMPPKNFELRKSDGTGVPTMEAACLYSSVLLMALATAR